MSRSNRIILTLFVLTALLLLGSGSEMLEHPVKVLFGFPLGNIVTWLGLISLSVLSRAGMITPSIRMASNILITAAWTWLPLGYLLSGNVRFSFRGTQYAWQIFLAYSLLIALGSLTLLIFSFYLKKKAPAD